MADIFISYKRDERQQVSQLAEALAALGLTVWFDASLSAGEIFSDEIDREARAAKAILVCWSPTARESKWVKAEAEIGFAADKLAATYVSGPDGFAPPVPFNTIHAEDLRSWLSAPDNSHAGWRSLLRRIGRLCQRQDIESWGGLDTQATAAQLRAWINTHIDSPLLVSVDQMLRRREAQDAERTKLEEEARIRNARAAEQRRKDEQIERLKVAAARNATPTNVVQEYTGASDGSGGKIIFGLTASLFVLAAVSWLASNENSVRTFAFLQQWQIALPIVLASMAAFFFAGWRWTALYVGLMPFINWSFAAVQTYPIPDWLGGGMFQPLAIVTGLVLVVRDFAQRELKHWIWGAMAVGLLLSTLTSWITIVVASGFAFLISETVDWAVYTFSNRPLSQRIMISSLASAPLDQVVFIGLASLVVPDIFAWGTVLTGIISKLLGAWIVSRIVAAQERRGAKNEMNPV